MKVATYSTHGMHAGRVIELRQVTGPQLWRIRVRTRRHGGQSDEQTITPAQRVPLGALTELVIQTIRECCGPGERLAEAQMDFYVRPDR